MNKLFWIGFYFGQNVIFHEGTGKWTLTGYFDNQVMCKKHEGTPEEDCEIFPIEEISFVFKKINPWLFASLHNSHSFIANKAKSGYWVFKDSSVNIMFEEEKFNDTKPI
jgi:hypothetical protein